MMPQGGSAWTEVSPQLVNNQPFLYEFDIDMTSSTVG